MKPEICKDEGLNGKESRSRNSFRTGLISADERRLAFLSVLSRAISHLEYAAALPTNSAEEPKPPSEIVSAGRVPRPRRSAAHRGRFAYPGQRLWKCGFSDGCSVRPPLPPGHASPLRWRFIPAAVAAGLDRISGPRRARIAAHAVIAPRIGRQPRMMPACRLARLHRLGQRRARRRISGMIGS